jgi:hypothetical protein
MYVDNRVGEVRVGGVGVGSGPDHWIGPRALAGGTDTDPVGGSAIAAIRAYRLRPVRAAFAAGELTADRARVIADAVNRLSPTAEEERVTAAVVTLIEQAPGLTFEELRRAANHLVEVVDPDGADAILAGQLEEQERRALQSTRLRFSRCGDGTTRLSGRLPDLAADMLSKALDGLSAPRRRSARDGESPTAAEQGPACSPVFNPDGDHSGSEIGLLTHPQSLGRALVELIEHLPSDRLPQAGGLSATVVVSIDLDALRSGLGAAVLDTGTEVSAGQARRLACNARLHG